MQRSAEGCDRPAGAQRALTRGLILAVDLIGQAVSVEVDAADVRAYTEVRPCRELHSRTDPENMKIGSIDLAPAFALAPMAGMTDTAFRRLVKREGGCGLVVTEMVSSEGLVRGIDRTLEYAGYTEEERPVSIQIFGGDPEKMAAAAQIVEGMGADIVDVNMGCPVQKIAKHNAGCSLMREPEHAASVVRAMAKAVKIPGHGEDARGLGCDELQRAGPGEADRGRGRVGGCGARPDGGAVVLGLLRLGLHRAGGERRAAFRCSAAATASSPSSSWSGSSRGGVSGVLVGRGALRNPWIFRQAADLAAGRTPRVVTDADRAQFLLDYIEMLQHERLHEAEGFRHVAPGQPEAVPAVSRARRAATIAG